jgi:hypothetical protein
MYQEEESICSIVRQKEQDYINGTTTLSKYVEFSQYDNLEKIEAYLNSKHISGETDSMGREKPFFNIVTSAVNIWYRATDIDRKDIRIKATKFSDVVASFLATVHLQEWMKKENFGTFLNDWGRSLARYGSTVLKFVEADGTLKPSVIPWNRLITDTIDFENNVVIEKLYYTPAQLRKNKSYDQEMVEALLDSATKRETIGGEQKDNLSGYICVYEVHGELPLSYLTDKQDDEIVYRQQMHVVSFVGKKERSGRSMKYDDYTLYKGRETKNPYMITHLIREDGRAQAIGAVEHLFEAQWMQNHSVKQIKDQLDLASKLIFQTSDGNYAGRNVLTSIENGDIMVHAIDEPLTHLANNSQDITSLQNFAQQWKQLGNEINGISESLMGQQPPSGTAWRQTQALLQESHSLFEIMTENKGLHIEDMVRTYIIPYLKKQMDTTAEVVATLDDQGIAQFDAMYVPSEAIRQSNNQIKEQILNGEIADQPDMQGIEQGIRNGLAQNGSQRFIKPSEISSKTWKELFSDLEWEVEVEVTAENTNKEAVLTTLSTVLQTVAANPLVLQDPNMRLVFNKILTETGNISPLQLSTVAAQPPVQTQPAPQAAPVPAEPPQPIQALNQLTK